MRIIELYISALYLVDVRRRSLYISCTLFGRTVWVQYWPRPIAGKRFLTCGARGFA